MSSVFDRGAPPPCPAPFNLAAYVLEAGLARPDRPALEILPSDGGPAEVWTHERLRRAVLGTAAGLLQSVAEPGDRVLMRLGNTPAFPVAYLGAIAAGLVPIPTAADLTEPEVAKIITITGPVLTLRGPGVACPGDAPGQIATDALEAMNTLAPAAPQMGDPERPAYILFTSGTSGQPRALVHAHRAIWARRMMRDGWYSLRESDRMLHAGGFNWSFTLGTGLMDPWTIGATALIPEPGTDPARLPDLLRRHRATLFAAAPGIYRRILKQPGKIALPDLRHALAAGEKLPTATQDAWRTATGTAIHEAYGMSECSTFISASPATPAHGTLGTPQPGRRVAILGGNGLPVPNGQPGVIAVHRSDPGLMLGYLAQPEDTAARMRGDWFVTGDNGSMAEDGQITYLGRDDDMMNAGGFRVSPIEVEQTLAAHPEIAEVAVTEVAVKPGTSVIAAFYVAARDLPEADLHAFATQRLARYKQPRIYRRIDALPRGANNKVLRKVLRSRSDEAARNDEA